MHSASALVTAFLSAASDRAATADVSSSAAGGHVSKLKPPAAGAWACDAREPEVKPPAAGAVASAAGEKKMDDVAGGQKADSAKADGEVTSRGG